MLRIGKADTLVLGLIDGARVEDLGLLCHMTLNYAVDFSLVSGLGVREGDREG